MEPIYSTQDIVLAATLRCLDYKLDNINIKGNKGTFEFLSVPEQVVIDYDLGNLLVEPQALNSAIKQLTTTCRRMADSRGYKDVK